VTTPGQPGEPAARATRTSLRPVQASPVPMPRGRRQTELAMLAFAIGLVLFAYASVGLSMTGRIPAGIVVYGIAFTVLMLLAHLAIRWLAPWADPLMLPLAALLNGLGIVMIYRLQQSGRDGNSGRVISTMSTSSTALQVVWSTVGVAAFIAVLAVIREPRTLQRYTYTFGVIGLVLLAIPALPGIGSEVNGARYGSASAASPSSRASSPSWHWPCSSPATWSPSGTCSRSRAVACSASTCRARATSARCSSRGAPACSS